MIRCWEPGETARFDHRSGLTWYADEGLRLLDASVPASDAGLVRDAGASGEADALGQRDQDVMEAEWVPRNEGTVDIVLPAAAAVHRVRRGGPHHDRHPRAQVCAGQGGPVGRDVEDTSCRRAGHPFVAGITRYRLMCGSAGRGDGGGFLWSGTRRAEPCPGSAPEQSDRSRWARVSCVVSDVAACGKRALELGRAW